MAERQGGMRRPANPAPVSGPGSLSQRTDGGPQQVLSDVSGMPYGENQELEEMQSAAPMSASGQTTARATRSAPRRSARGRGGMGVSPLMSPTQRPDEPITAGAPFGPGAGPRPVYNTGAARPKLSDTLTKIVSNTGDPKLDRLSDIARRLGW